MWAAILEFLNGLVAAIPILARYFPPKATEQTVEEDEAAIEARLKKERETGRPQ